MLHQQEYYQQQGQEKDQQQQQRYNDTVTTVKRRKNRIVCIRIRKKCTIQVLLNLLLFLVLLTVMFYQCMMSTSTNVMLAILVNGEQIIPVIISQNNDHDINIDINNDIDIDIDRIHETHTTTSTTTTTTFDNYNDITIPVISPKPPPVVTTTFNNDNDKNDVNSNIVNNKSQLSSTTMTQTSRTVTGGSVQGQGQVPQGGQNSGTSTESNDTTSIQKTDIVDITTSASTESTSLQQQQQQQQNQNQHNKKDLLFHSIQVISSLNNHMRNTNDDNDDNNNPNDNTSTNTNTVSVVSSTTLTFYESMICGAISRSIAQLVLHPLICMKAIIQYTSKYTTDTIGTVTTGSSTSITYKDLLHYNKIHLLFKGSVANFILSLPTGAITFSVLESTRKFLQSKLLVRTTGSIPNTDTNTRTDTDTNKSTTGTTSSTTTTTTTTNNNNNQHLIMIIDLVSSMISTIVTSTIISTPQMMIVDNIMVGHYNNMIHAIIGLYKKHNSLQAFYSGWYPGLVSKLPSYALTYSIFQQLKLLRSKKLNNNNSKLQFKTQATIISSVQNQQQQQQQSYDDTTQATTTTSTIRTPQTATKIRMFITRINNSIKNKIQLLIIQPILYNIQQIQLFLLQFENTILACIASTTATCIMIPLDTIKTRLVAQTGSSSSTIGNNNVVLRKNYNGIIDCCQRMIKEEGFFTLYSGLLPRLLSVVPSIGIQFGVYEFLKSYFINQHQVKQQQKEQHQQNEQHQKNEQQQQQQQPPVNLEQTKTKID